MSTKLFARHGDLVIDRLATPITGDMSPTTDLVFAGDSSGHRHRLIGTSESRRDGRTTLVRIAAPRKLSHDKPDGHKTITLPAGDYSVRPLRERGDEGDRAVED